MKEKSSKGKWRSIKETAQLFKKLRAKKSSMEEIAKAMGRDVKYLYNILPKIAEILGVPHEELLFQHKTTKTSEENSNENFDELQTRENVDDAEAAQSVVVDEVAETTGEFEDATYIATEAKATNEDEADASTEDVAAPETVSSEIEAKEIITNSTLVGILKELEEARSIIKNMNIY